MVEVKRFKHSVIVCDEDENRGIAFPVKEKTEAQTYVFELQEVTANMKYGMVIVPLLADPKYAENYRPLKKFMTEKKRKYTDLRRDAVAEQLYNFYFKNAIPQISPGGVSYIFVG